METQPTETNKQTTHPRSGTHSKQNQFNNNSDSISGHSVLSGGGSYMETQATETNKTSPEWSTL